MTVATYIRCPFCVDGEDEEGLCHNCDATGSVQVCARCGAMSAMDLSPTITVCDPCFMAEQDDEDEAPIEACPF